jgi:sugar/nucleoside kinase (ribokinase family)
LKFSSTGINSHTIKCRDTDNAGDAMLAGVLHGYLAGALTAAMALSQYGDQVITDSVELEALLDQGDVDISR